MDWTLLEQLAPEEAQLESVQPELLLQEPMARQLVQPQLHLEELACGETKRAV